MKKAIKTLFALLFLISTVSGALAAEKMNKPEIKTVDNYIAVFDFEVTTGDKGISRPLADRVIHEFSTSDRYKVIDRGNMNKILKEQKFQISGCVAQECKVEAGQILGVGKIVNGSVGIVGKTYYLTLQLIDVRTGEIVKSAEDTCKCEVDELLDSTKKLAKKLLGEKVEPPEATILKHATAPESKAEEITKAEGIAKAKAEETERAKAAQIAKTKAEVEATSKTKAEEIEIAKVEQIAKAKAEAEEKVRAEEIAKTKAEEVAKVKAKAEAEEIAKAQKHELKATIAAFDPAVVSPKIVASDGRYEKLASGVVRDTQSGLDWYAGPDKNTSWGDANSWAANLRVDGGDWRMPMITELKGIYQKGAGSRNITPMLETTGWWIWSGEAGANYSVTTPGGAGGLGGYQLCLDLDTGREYSDRHENTNYKRVFAVRSRR